MAGERQLPGLGLTGFWTPGSDGWAAQNDVNLRLLSAIVQLSVISRTTSLPGVPADGDIYIVPSGDTNGNKVAVRDNGAWVYLAAQDGWQARVRDVDEFVFFDGAAWSPFAAEGLNASEVSFDSGSSVADVLSELQASVSDLQDRVSELESSGVGGGGGGGVDHISALFHAVSNSASSAAFAYKGLTFIPRQDIEITQVFCMVTKVNGAHYNAIVAPISDATALAPTITSSPTFGTAVASSDTELETIFIDFPTPVSLTAGQSYVIAFGRTDGGNTYVLPNRSSTGGAFPAIPGLVKYEARIANQTPANGHSIDTNTRQAADYLIGVLWNYPS